MLNKLLKQGLHYASGSLLLSLASLISFPILTRYLPVEQYGYLSLITTISGLLAAIYKLGLQQSIVRFFKPGDHALASNVAYTFLLTTFIISVFISLIAFFTLYEFGRSLIIVIILIAFLQSMRSVVIGLYMSMQNSLYVNIVNVIYKYGSLFFMLIFIFYYEKSAISVVFSILVTDLLLMFIVFKRFVLDVTFLKPNVELIKKVSIYGFPLMLVEVLQIGHAFTDRFIINYFLDSKSVAMYVAPHSISRIISDVIFGGVATALVPIYMGMWKEEEFDNAKKFINKISDYFLYIFPISVAGLYVISEPLMSILASEKYSESSYILPITFLGVGLFASTFIYSAGLKIKKNQFKLLQFVFESLIINLVLNFIFIKKYGIAAAAWTTVLSYLWMTIRFYIESKPVIEVNINTKYLLYGVLVSLLMIFMDYYFIDIETGIYDIMVTVFLGIILASFVLLKLSSELREIIFKKLNF